MDDSEQGIGNGHLFDAGSIQPSSGTLTQGGRQRTTTHSSPIMSRKKQAKKCAEIDTTLKTTIEVRNNSVLEASN